MKPVECVWVCYRGGALQIGLLDKKQRMCEVLLEISHASFCVFEVYGFNLDGYFCFNCYAWNCQFCDLVMQINNHSYFFVSEFLVSYDTVT